MQDESIDWRQLREFASVDLTCSYVLSWNLDAESLLIDIDVLLLPEHPFYEKPRPREKVCIRPALMEFPYCDDVTTGSRGDGDDAAATVARLGHGAIHGLKRLPDERYELSGDFGVVYIDSERPLLRLKNP